MSLPKCHTCDGSGWHPDRIARAGSPYADPCPDCGGTGRRPNYEAAYQEYRAYLAAHPKGLGSYRTAIKQAVDAALEDTPQ